MTRSSSVSRHLLLGFGVEIVAVSGVLHYLAGYRWLFAVIAAIALIVAIRLAVSGASFVVASLWGDGLRRTPLTIAEWRTLVLREMGAVLRLFFFYHPFAPWLERGSRDSGWRGAAPVVLVHGFFSNAGFWWSLRRRLRQRGVDGIFTIELEPAFGDLDGYAQQLAASIEELCASTGADRVILVAHSMGGLVCRAYLRDFGERRVLRLLTIASPHGGTCLARLLPWWRNVSQMRINGKWLTQLGRQTPRIPVVCVYSDHDNIIIPQSSATLAIAENLHVPAVGHLDMAFAAPVLELVSAQIKAARR